MGIINKIKEVIVAKRIRAMINPAVAMTELSTECYSEILAPYLHTINKLTKVSAIIISEHADSIAKAIVNLEPVYKAFKESEQLKETFVQMSDAVSSISEKYEDKMQEQVKAIEEASKIDE